MITRPLQALTVLGAVLLIAAAPVPPRAGVYSSVCVDAESDDTDGAELTFSYRAGKPQVRLFVCEGACSEEPTSAVSLVGQTLRFVGEERSVDGNGRKLPSVYEHFVARFSSGALTLTDLNEDGVSWGRLRYRPGRTRPPGDDVVANGQCR